MESIKADELVDERQKNYRNKLIERVNLETHIFYFFMGLTSLGVGAIIHYLM